jgi:hypothetical protein
VQDMVPCNAPVVAERADFRGVLSLLILRAHGAKPRIVADNQSSEVRCSSGVSLPRRTEDVHVGTVERRATAQPRLSSHDRASARSDIRRVVLTKRIAHRIALITLERGRGVANFLTGDTKSICSSGRCGSGAAIGVGRHEVTSRSRRDPPHEVLGIVGACKRPPANGAGYPGG